WLGRLCGCSNNSWTSETPVTSGNINNRVSPDLANEKSTSVLQFLTIPAKYDIDENCDEDDLENDSGPTLSYSRSIGDSQPSMASTATTSSMVTKNEILTIAASPIAPLRSESIPSYSSESSDKTTFAFSSDYISTEHSSLPQQTNGTCNANTLRITSQKKKKSLKLLFLDIDGEHMLGMYCAHFFRNKKIQNVGVLCFSGHIISSVHLNRILQIMKKTQCKIVLSTTWRLQSHLKQRIFEAFAHAMANEVDSGLPCEKSKVHVVNVHEHIIGQTPDFKHLRPRAFEIMAFVDAVKTFPDVHLQDWVVIDDSNLFAPCVQDDVKRQMKEHFVRCNTNIGITEEIMETIIAKLNGHSNICCTNSRKDTC
ncbi:hypothetical protein RFI_16185, partial [Reticulomyxa filosa]